MTIFDSNTQRIQADLTWTGDAFEAGVVVEVDEEGRIARIGRGEGLDSGESGPRRLRGRALLPGFVNAHSHAFQRGLRGRGESFPAGAGSFWGWREEMYRLVETLDAGGFRRLCLQTFGEMRAAGITCVGEFHYLHHDDAEALDGTFDEIVLSAAVEAGIRLVLLQAYYRTGGPGRELEGGQRRFSTPTPEGYWRRMDDLEALLDPRLQALGAVAHSLRAATPAEIRDLTREAKRRGLAFHLHLEEQRSEIEQTVAAYGRRPMELLLDALDGTAEGVTAVHCTHTEPPDLGRFFAAGGRTCVCPLTEANLGDGLPALGDSAEGSKASAALASLCLGTDSNARLSMLEEMRWLEYGQRLAGERRGTLRDARGEVAPGLIRAATLGGARSLGLQVGAIESGVWADFVAIDLTHPSLAGAEADTLAAALVFGAGNEAVAATCVGGRWQEHRG